MSPYEYMVFLRETYHEECMTFATIPRGYQFRIWQPTLWGDWVKVEGQMTQ